MDMLAYGAIIPGGVVFIFAKHVLRCTCLYRNGRLYSHFSQTMAVSRGAVYALIRNGVIFIKVTMDFSLILQQACSAKAECRSPTSLQS